MKIDIPGFKTLELTHAFFDLNGTLADLGQLTEVTKDKVRQLSEKLSLHLVTSDTRGAGKRISEELGLPLTIIPADRPAREAKLEILRKLGPERTVVFGNGANDELVLREASLGIVVLGAKEGAATSALIAGDMVVQSIECALDCLLDPLRLIATLRR